jgi:polyphosphate kinase
MKQMLSQHLFRFQVRDRDTLDQMVADPLPAGFTDGGAEVELLRDIYYDSAAGDIEARGAQVRLRLRNEGPAEFTVSVLERDTDDEGAIVRSGTVQLEQPDHAALFEAGSRPHALVSSLIDPSRLVAAIELEVVRWVRRIGPAAGPSRFDLVLDLITVRSGEMTDELFEVEFAVPEGNGAAACALADQLASRYALKPVTASVASRALHRVGRLEQRALRRDVRVAREVAVVVHERGAIALVDEGGNLCMPWAPGSGARACRRALRRTFGHGRARIRLLGVRGDVPGRPAVEVWLAEDVAPGEQSQSATWLPVGRALRQAGAPRMRDARTLAALQVVARSSFLNWAPPASGEGVMPRRLRTAEPFEVVLQRLEASDPSWEQPHSGVPPDLLLNMELSRLSFDERVLAIADDPAVPLLERLRFLSMFGARRDDFFMSRVAHFKRLLVRDETARSIDGLTPAETLDAIATRVRDITHTAYEILNSRLLPALQEHGIRIEPWSALSDDDRSYVWSNFGERIDALVMPIVADPAHPFPHVRNLRPALAAIVRTPESGAEQFVAIEMPGELPRFVPLPGGRRFVQLEDVIEAALPRLYPGLEVLSAHTFRVTRSAHMDLTGEPLDMLQAVEEEVSRRPFQEVVRLEVENTMPPGLRHELLREFQFEIEEQLSTPGEQDVYTAGRVVDLASLAELAALDMPELRFQPMRFQSPLDEDRSVFDQIGERDRLFHFPYDHFEGSVERFLFEAADDPDVVSMRATLYRTSPDSGVVAALRQARARGKEVAVLVELKASFDERRNIEWARGLQQDGIRVVFSPIRFKVHAKIALVVRREGEEMRRYAYIGTGNLNAATARSYVDIGLLTADRGLAREVGAVFNLLTGYSGGGEISRLLVAPFDMRRRLLRLIDREASHASAGRPARIRLQLNGLADRRLIGALYRASAAGVRIELMVREICSLRPGVPGVSDNITVVSVVGRLLQHARIFHFHNAGEDEYYIGSADWRPRNMAERIEVAAPVTDPGHHRRLDAILDATLNDPGAWRLLPDGEHTAGSASAMPVSR